MVASVGLRWMERTTGLTNPFLLIRVGTLTSLMALEFDTRLESVSKQEKLSGVMDRFHVAIGQIYE